MADESQRCKVAILTAAASTDQPGFTEPKQAIHNVGADVDATGIQTREARIVKGDVNPDATFTMKKSFCEVVPGGIVQQTSCVASARRLA